MNFFFAKLFEEYQRKNDSANFNITLYISLFYFFLLFALYLPVSESVNKIYFKNEFTYNKTILAICVFSVLITITYSVYVKYIKRGFILSLTKTYRGKSINRNLLYSLTALFPLFFLLLGATATVLIKGGTILNYHFKGMIWSIIVTLKQKNRKPNISSTYGK